MLHVHTIGRIGKDCQVISGAHGSFMAMDIAVDDYSKGQNNHHLDKGTQQQGQPYPLVRISDERETHTCWRHAVIFLWKDKNGESQIQLSITAESIAFINTGRREGAAAGEDNAVSGADGAPVPPADFPQDEKEDLPFW